MRPLTLSAFAHAKAPGAHHHSLTFDELAARLEPKGTSKDGPAICGAVFDPAHRSIANVQRVEALILDVDSAEGTIGDLTRPLVDYDAILWTTWRHTDPMRPRYRHLLPLTRPVTPAEYGPLWQYVNKLLGGIVDPNAKDAARLQYMPRATGVSGKPATVIVHRARGWLDPDNLPGSVSVSELIPPPRPPREDLPPPDQDELLEALHAIDPARLSYQEWLEVGMALHAEGLDVSAWQSWTGRDKRDDHAHRIEQCDYKWHSFTRSGITAGTIYHHAHAAGWHAEPSVRVWEGSLHDDSTEQHDDDRPKPPERHLFSARNDSLVADHLLAHHATDEPLVYDLGAFWRYESPAWLPLGGEAPGDTLAATLHDWQRHGRMWLPPTEKHPNGAPYILSSAQQQSIIRHARIPAQRIDFFDKAPDGIAFADVFVRVHGRDLVIEPITPDHRQRHAYPFAYDDRATCPQTDLRLREILAGVNDADTEDRVRLVWQFWGAALLGIAPRFMRAMVLHGRKGSGKSTVGAMVAASMPDGSVDAVAPRDFADDRKAIAFANMRLNYIAELDHEHPIKSHTIVKTIIGGEYITARDVFRSKMTFRPRAAHLWCANRVPQVPGVDESFWDRFLVLRCSQQFRGTSREVTGLASSLAREEMQGIARRALDGARDLLECGRYAIPASSIGALREWLNQADAVALFLDEACVPSNEPSASRWSSATEVYETFCRWADRRGHQKMSYAELLQRIESRGYERTRSNGTRVPLNVREQHQWDSRTWDVADDEPAPF